ncbi:unknown [[Mannheimia] succiniciproducens MBEL55E]|uniref:Uncharacterized protein n=1 Tax=Mannheimia succiniciproducens (strain KCTC 0769BP / MBEL55E) TaxID=221988 RepID=Q65TV6_MANSM|nr:unknown [[Mannheimia] succiniciproducens MBEL55E]
MLDHKMKNYYLQANLLLAILERNKNKCYFNSLIFCFPSSAFSKGTFFMSVFYDLFQ